MSTWISNGHFKFWPPNSFSSLILVFIILDNYILNLQNNLEIILDSTFLLIFNIQVN
jgi:hypothetical protein